MSAGKKPWGAGTQDAAGRSSGVSKCTTCISPCTPASVRPAHRVLTGCVAKRPRPPPAPPPPPPQPPPLGGAGRRGGGGVPWEKAPGRFERVLNGAHRRLTLPAAVS